MKTKTPAFWASTLLCILTAAYSVWLSLSTCAAPRRDDTTPPVRLEPIELEAAASSGLIPIADTTLSSWNIGTGNFWSAESISVRSESYTPIEVAVLKWDVSFDPSGGGTLSLKFLKRSNTNGGVIEVYHPCSSWDEKTTFASADVATCYLYGKVIGRLVIPADLTEGQVLNIAIGGFDPAWGVMVSLRSSGSVRYSFASKESSDPPMLRLNPPEVWPVTPVPTVTLVPTLEPTPSPTPDTSAFKCTVIEDIVICIQKLTTPEEN